MKFKDIVFDKNGAGNYIVQKEFFSKRNKVFLIDIPDEGRKERYILKQFNNPDSWDNEIKVAKILEAKDVPIPKLYYSSRYYSISEYLDGGELLLDTIIKLEERNESIDYVAEQLSLWLKAFYSSSGNEGTFVMDDVNFRNFIMREKIYGIDFEGCRRGNMEEDAGRICAYFLMYTPEFTDWKIRMASRMLDILTENLGLDRGYSLEELHKGLIGLGIRRNLIIPSDIMNNFTR